MSPLGTVAIFAALIATWVSLAVLVYRLILAERILDVLCQRFEEAGIDLTVTEPLQTNVVVPERWDDVMEEGIDGQPREYPDQWAEDRAVK